MVDDHGSRRQQILFDCIQGCNSPSNNAIEKQTYAVQTPGASNSLGDLDESGLGLIIKANLVSQCGEEADPHDNSAENE